jgi:hypothetical protein
MLVQARDAVEFVQIRLPSGGAQNGCGVLLAVVFVAGGRRILRFAAYQVANEREEPVVTALDILDETLLRRQLASFRLLKERGGIRNPRVMMAR